MQVDEGQRQRIRVGRTEMDFQHEGRTLTAIHPFCGPTNSLGLSEQIRDKDARAPTAPELVSFTSEYFQKWGGGSQTQEFNKILRDRRGFVGFTGALYIPEKAIVHFIDFPKFNRSSIAKRNSSVDVGDLLNRLSESRAHISFDNLLNGPVALEDMKNHPHLIAWAGEEGADKLYELAIRLFKPNHSYVGYVRIPELSDLREPVARAAVLGINETYTDYGGGLEIGEGNGVISYGHSFGVLD